MACPIWQNSCSSRHSFPSHRTSSSGRNWNHFAALSRMYFDDFYQTASRCLICQYFLLFLEASYKQAWASTEAWMAVVDVWALKCQFTRVVLWSFEEQKSSYCYYSWINLLIQSSLGSFCGIWAFFLVQSSFASFLLGLSVLKNSL